MNPGKPSAEAVQLHRVYLLCAPRNSVSVIAPTLWLIAEKSADCLPIVGVTETNKHLEADLLQIESRGERKGKDGKKEGKLHKSSSAHNSDSEYSLCLFFMH